MNCYTPRCHPEDEDKCLESSLEIFKVFELRAEIRELVRDVYPQEGRNYKWTKPPGWPSHVPFVDPNNKNNASAKPIKQTLEEMAYCLEIKYLEKNHHLLNEIMTHPPTSDADDVESQSLAEDKRHSFYNTEDIFGISKKRITGLHEIATILDVIDIKSVAGGNQLPETPMEITPNDPGNNALFTESSIFGVKPRMTWKNIQKIAVENPTHYMETFLEISKREPSGFPMLGQFEEEEEEEKEEEEGSEMFNGCMNDAMATTSNQIDASSSSIYLSEEPPMDRQFWEAFKSPRVGLTSTHVNAASYYLKRKHPWIDGLYDAAVYSRPAEGLEGLPRPQGKFVQALSTSSGGGGDIWLVVSNLLCSRGEVDVYDASRRSGGRCRDYPFRALSLIYHLCGHFVGRGRLKLRLQDVRWRPGKASDGAAIAVAFMASLCQGQSPVAHCFFKRRDLLIEALEGSFRERFELPFEKHKKKKKKKKRMRGQESDALPLTRVLRGCRECGRFVRRPIGSGSQEIWCHRGCFAMLGAEN